jgi:hypothetical protein
MANPGTTMSVQKRLWDLVVLAIVIFAAAFAAAPWFAFRALKAAAQDEDVQAIGELVDFPAVRASLTGQLKALPPAGAAAEPPSLWRDPLEVFRRAMTPIAPPEPKVDRYLTVPGLAALTAGYRPGAVPPASTEPPTAGERVRQAVTGPYPTIAYWDPNRVRIAVRRPGQPAKVTLFTFRRDALFTWKLAHVRLPPDER